LNSEILNDEDEDEYLDDEGDRAFDEAVRRLSNPDEEVIFGSSPASALAGLQLLVQNHFGTSPTSVENVTSSKGNTEFSTVDGDFCSLNTTINSKGSVNEDARKVMLKSRGRRLQSAIRLLIPLLMSGTVACLKWKVTSIYSYLTLLP